MFTNFGKSFIIDVLIGLEAVVGRCSSKWVFLKIEQISKENTCVGVSF